MVKVAQPITPVVASFITGQLSRANQEGNVAFLCELDTPGGLDTAMRDIIQGIMNSQVPVIVFVAPAGARAASAGALITLAADFAAMAPGTNIGAAHPVSIGPGGGGNEGKEKGGDSTMMEKVENDAAAYARSIAERRGRNREWAEKMVRESVSVSAGKALELKLIDLMADDTADLLQALDGRHYLRQGQKRILHSAGADLVEGHMNWRQELLNTLSNPNVAYLLLMLGILGIFFEVSQPGVIFPGAVGAIAILLALYSFQTLPINYAGILLILLAVVLFILEIKVASYGMLTVGGIVSLTLGSIMLLEDSAPYQQISPVVIAATVAVCSGFFILVVFFVARTQKTRFVSGIEGMIGERGEAVTDIDGRGRVFVHGEYWNAIADETISAGEPIEIERVEEGMRLKVRKISGEKFKR